MSTMNERQRQAQEHQAELERRLQQYLDGNRYALDGFDEPDGFDKPAQQPVVMNAGERRVRDEYERRRPVLDPATQKLWDHWFDTRFGKAIKPLAEHIGTAVGEMIEEFNKATEAHNELIKDLEEIHDEGIKEHNQLARDVEAIRGDLHREVSDQIKRLDRQFVAEIAMMRQNMITKLSDDLTVMKDDLVGILRAELASEFVRMVEGARIELRAEMRKELSVRIKAMRSIFRK